MRDGPATDGAVPAVREQPTPAKGWGSTASDPPAGRGRRARRADLGVTQQESLHSGQVLDAGRSLQSLPGISARSRVTARPRYRPPRRSAPQPVGFRGRCPAWLDLADRGQRIHRRRRTADVRPKAAAGADPGTGPSRG